MNVRLHRRVYAGEFLRRELYQREDNEGLLLMYKKRR